MKKYLLFDNDGVLVDTEQWYFKANVEILRHMGITLTLGREDFELIHAKRGLVEHMDFVLCSGEYEKSKPHPHPYLKALELFKAEKEEAIVIEDSQRGLMSASAAEIECVVVHNTFTSNHDFSLANHKIDSLNNLKKLLLHL